MRKYQILQALWCRIAPLQKHLDFLCQHLYVFSVLALFLRNHFLSQVTAVDDGNVQRSGTDIKSGISAPHLYQPSGTGARTSDPLSHGAGFARPSDGRSSDVGTRDAYNRQFDHTTIDREVVTNHILLWLIILQSWSNIICGFISDVSSLPFQCASLPFIF